jgi:hypothetical protein
MYFYFSKNEVLFYLYSQFHIDRVEKSIEKYLSQMDTKDGDEKDIDTTVTTSKLAWLEAHLVELKALEKEVNEHPDKQVPQTDPDARLMQTHHMERRVCYNIGALGAFLTVHYGRFSVSILYNHGIMVNAG